MRRVFKTRHFSRWMRKSELTDTSLCLAVQEMSAGLVDADLGGGVLKKRVALPGRGKRGSARTLVATRSGGHWFFVFGFEKNERDNIDGKALEALQSLALDLFKLVGEELDVLVSNESLKEICHGDKNQGPAQ
jgi:hypothetical protein